MTEYKSNRFVDGKVRHVIVNEIGKIVNRNPSKDELKGLKKELYKDRRIGSNTNKKYTDKELLDYLIQFKKENEKVPVAKDFANNPEYPSYNTYRYNYGSWSNALKLVGMDLDTRVVQGCLNTEIEKARYAEIKVINHFKQHPIDIAGKNCKSPFDGICPNGKTYDVKGSKLKHERKCWTFNTFNKYKEDIEIYYFLAFNSDWTKLEYAWRIPGEMANKDSFVIGLNHGYEFNIENMKEYDITDKFKDLLF